jgi:protein-L-isoaspartate(D-aspartate) O-methyltransferase
MTEPVVWLPAKRDLSKALFGGVLSWRSLAFERAARHMFVPKQALRSYPDRPDLERIDWDADPHTWFQAVYSNDVIVTQQDEDGRSTSSCSQPEMVFAMLDLLDPQRGEKVLEIGTGTGWNAGLLACYLGAEHVVSVEIDPQVAEDARRHLRVAALPVRVITGDGAQGAPEDAPFDRVICTASVHRVPYAWVAQTLRGGVIVTPWRTDFDSGAIVKLTVADDGTSASGQFRLGSSFMSLRAQHFDAPDAPDDFTTDAAVSYTTVDLSDVFGESARFAIGLLVPGCLAYFQHDEHGVIETVWLCAADSWASVHLATTVRQYGKRRLWDEVEAAYGWFMNQAMPDYTRFGITVTADEQRIWLDSPHQLVTKTNSPLS